MAPGYLTVLSAILTTGLPLFPSLVRLPYHDPTDASPTTPKTIVTVVWVAVNAIVIAIGVFKDRECKRHSR